MTDYYLDTDLGSDGDGSSGSPWNSWASVTGLAVGDRVFFDSSSTETRTSTTTIYASTNNNRGGYIYIAVDNLTDKNYTPASGAGGELAVDVGNGDIQVNDTLQIYGGTFRTVSGSDDIKVSASTAEPSGYFECEFICESQSDLSLIGGVHDSCTYGGGSSSGTMFNANVSVNGMAEVFNPSFEGAGSRGTVCQAEAGMEAMGGDLSPFNKGGGISLFTNNARQPQYWRGAKMPASWDIHSGIGSNNTPYGNRFTVIGCTDDATNDPGHFQATHRNWLFTKTTATYVTAQPSKQVTDTTPHSIEAELVHTESWDYYFEGGAGALPISALANTQTTSLTLTWEFLVADATSTTALTSDAVWVYVWYLASATSPQVTQLKSRPFDPTNVLTLAAGTGTGNWTIDGSVPANRASYKIAHTFTPAQAGPIYYQVRVAGLMGNDEMYYDPIPIQT